MGITPVPWSEIAAFSDRSAHSLNGWESEIIYMMSCEYVGMHNKADGKNCVAPYSLDISSDEKTLQEMHDEVDKQLDKLFA